MLRIFFSLVISLSFFKSYSQNDVRVFRKIEKLRGLSKNGDYSRVERLSYAKEACSLSFTTKIDSTILKSNIVLSGLYLYEDDYEGYKSINFDNLKRGRKIKDSSSIAYALHNLGWYYDYNAKYDSAYYYYYNAQKFYKILRERRKESSVLLNMAIIQEEERDYMGAEKNAIVALELTQNLTKNDDVLDTMWSLHNLLANISSDLRQYTVALEYYNKALDIASKMKNPYYYNLNAKNNIGNIYNKLGEYEKALLLFEELVKDDKLLSVGPDLYVISLSNLANTKNLLKTTNTNEVSELFEKAYKISDSLNDKFGKIVSLSYRSDFWFKKNNKDSSFSDAKEAYKLSKEIRSNEFILKSLKRMSEIKKGELSKGYLNEYIKLNDSLLYEERAKRNKYARIEFETDQIKAENEQISKERLMFLMSSVGLLVTLILLYVIISQRAKNKELEFSKVQQEANEEIYNLMLAQQDKVDEGRTQEKKRISEELHDGILGRLFGTRLSLDSLNFVNTDDAVKTRGQYINELKSIEQEIRKISHDLNTDFVSGSSFSDIIQALIETQTQSYELAYDYHEDDDIDWDELSNKTKIHVYRMLQETMQNIYKHANAKHIKISFRLKNNVILLTVEDDGSGFNINKARKGIGLKNFDSRASEIGGKVEIFSNPGEGTKVIIHVPTE